MIIIDPKDIKLLLNKVERSQPIINSCKELIKFPSNASICYNIKIMNVTPLQGVEFVINDIILYESKNISTEYNIPIFTSERPLLLTHIDINKISMKLYGNVEYKNITIEYTYETINTKYQPIWQYIPVLHYVDGKFLFYKSNDVKLINITELNKFKGTFTNNVILCKDEYIIHVMDNVDVYKKFDNPRIKEISTLSEWKTASLPAAYIFNVKGSNKDEFMQLAANLWPNNPTNIFQKEVYKNTDDVYINFKKLADSINQ